MTSHRSWLVALVCLVATACQVDATVRIDVEDDGTGTVTVALELDEQAAQRLGDPDSVLLVDDLRTAGWTISSPVLTEDGGVRVAASKPFENPEQLRAVMSEITGLGGPIGEFTLLRSSSFAKTRYELDGSVDLSGGIETFGDDELAAVLGGRPVGWTPEELEEELGRPLDEMLTLTVEVAMPGSVGGQGATVSEGVAVWTVSLGEAEATAIAATGELTDTTARSWAAFAFGAAVLFVIWLVTMLVRRRRTPELAPAGPSTGELPAVATPPRPEAATTSTIVTRPVESDDSTEGEEGSAAAAGAPRRLQLIVLGGPGVVHEVAEVERRLLRPFVSDFGAELPLDVITDAYRRATMGTISSTEMWHELGFSGDVSSLDRAFLSRLRLMPDLIAFIERVRHRHIDVAVMTNGLAPWWDWLGRRFGIDDLVDHFVVSSTIGARLPDPAMYEALKGASEVPLRNVLYIDHDERLLDAGRAAGMATAWFMPPVGADPAGHHRHLRSLSVLFG